MRIALYHNLPSGGGKRALLEMVKGLVSQHTIDVYTLSCAEHDFCDVRPHVNSYIVFSFNPLPLFRRPLGRMNQALRTVDLVRLHALQKRIAGTIDRGRYDILFVHNCQFGQSPALLRFSSTPTAYYCQEPPRMLYEPPVNRPYSEFSTAQKLGNALDPLPGLYHRMLRRTDRRNVRSASRVLVNSAYSKESLYRAYGVFARTSYLGVDCELFRPQTQGNNNYVISVGALNPRKGFDFLIKSLALIPDRQRPKLLIVSNFADPREASYLVSLANTLDVDVTFRTQIGDDELVSLYAGAELTLYAPVMEPFGLVPLESMACGTPVVAVNEGGVRESVRHGVTGLLTERDPLEFANTVCELLGDPARLQQYGQQGRSSVEEHWGWPASIKVLEGHLTGMVSSAGTSTQ